eukprot:SAG22_NODE_2104_length_3006_cov_2.293430_3_plen_131_part_01
MTGDGKDNGGRSNFPDCCAAALDKGWRVEVFGWKASMSKRFYSLAQRASGRMAVNLLDADRPALIVPRAARSPATSPPRTPSPPLMAGGGGERAQAAGWGACRDGVRCCRPGCRYIHPDARPTLATGALVP